MGQQEHLQIFTLGRFAVYRAGRPVEAACTGKIWTVFKFLLTHREQAVPDELLLELFWPDASLSKARHALHNAIYRLRLVLESDRLRYKRCSIISVHEGLYSIRQSGSLWLDIDEMAQLVQAAESQQTAEPEAAMASYRKALELYQGDYLAEHVYEDWVKTAQDRYRNLYQRAAVGLAQMLFQARRFAELCQLCHAVLEKDPLQEEIQALQIEALIQTGSLVKARSHYERFSNLLMDEMGVSPSPQLQELYHRIPAQHQCSPLVSDLDAIQDMLNLREQPCGALVCESQVFQQIYRLEQRRLASLTDASYLVKLDITSPEAMSVTIPSLHQIQQDVERLLQKTLNPSDVVCHWNNNQYLLLFTNVPHNHVLETLRHIYQAFQTLPNRTGLVLRAKECELVAADEMMQAVGK